MKQIIDKYPNGSIKEKYYINDSGQRHGLLIFYWSDSYDGLMCKRNYLNGKRYGLETFYYSMNDISEHIYHL